MPKGSKVYTYATAGGTDSATLYDSPGNDRLKATPTYAYLSGDTSLNYAEGIRLRVRLRHGGRL